MIFILTLTLIPTILIEYGVLLLLGENRRKVLSASVVMNIFTNIPLNLYLLYVRDGWMEILLGEVIVLLVESIWYYCLVKNLRQAAIYSLLCNTISFLIGIFVQLIIISLNIE